jgi:hypothetical protein
MIAMSAAALEQALPELKRSTFQARGFFALERRFVSPHIGTEACKPEVWT